MILGTDRLSLAFLVRRVSKITTLQENIDGGPSLLNG